MSGAVILEDGRTPAPQPGRGHVARGAATLWWLSVALALGILVFQAALAREQPLEEWHSTWRYWDDMALAATDYLALREPVAEQATSVPVREAAPSLQTIVERQIQRKRIQPWEFWRTIPSHALGSWQYRAQAAPLEDRGRSKLLGIGYMATGGVAPYLLTWLVPLLALPVLCWMALELHGAGWRLAGPSLLVLCAASPYLIESLTLPHSSIGFYLLALFSVLTFSAWATGDRSPSPAGLWARAALLSLIFAVCTIARAGTVFMLPAIALSLHWAGGRHLGKPTTRRWRAWLRSALLVVLFLGPYAVLRPPHYHTVWLGFWEGLGDFGADRGYSWYDGDAQRVLAEAGLEPFTSPEAVTAEHERFFRDAVLKDVATHPVWYASVLTRRTIATLGLTHLLPWLPRDGKALETPRFHYKYTTPADWLSLGGRSIELPVELMWVAPLGTVLWAAWRGSSPAQVARREQALRLLLVMLVACLPLPVIVSTASGLETQAIVVGYFLSVGLLLDTAWVRASRLIASRAVHIPSTDVAASPRNAE